MIKVGIIGGSGLEVFNFIDNIQAEVIETPFGTPSSKLYTGKINGIHVVYLLRHGEDQKIPSSKINFRANIYALKSLNCTHIIATSNCGSLQEEICPGEFIICDQFIDFSKHRAYTMLEEYNPMNYKFVNKNEPFSDELRDNLIEVAIHHKLTVHTKGVILTIDGSRYPTRAETLLFKNWGADVINMTTAPEVTYANETGMHYAVIALCTNNNSCRGDNPAQSYLKTNELIDMNVHNLIAIIQETIMKF